MLVMAARGWYRVCPPRSRLIGIACKRSFLVRAEAIVPSYPARRIIIRYRFRDIQLEISVQLPKAATAAAVLASDLWIV
jgi:hypothetical protein